jgi:glycosyltransferase involved in cell wall biosynthesis
VKVAIFASSFWPHLGGVEELVRQLALEYGSRGIDTLVITNQWPRSLSEDEEVEGIRVLRFPFAVPDGSVRARLRWPIAHRRVERDVQQALKAHGVDLVHVQCVSSNGHYARRSARSLDLPLVVTSQGERTMDADRVYEHSRFLNQTLRELLTSANFVTACSLATLTDLEAYLGTQFDDRGSVIYNGISLAEFNSEHRSYEHPRPYVLAMGRWVPQKGFDVLLEAFAIAVQEAEFDHDLLLAGDGPQRGALEDLVVRLDLRGRAHLLGRADRQTSVQLFRGCSFFVLPSRQEPFGIVNVEAMAAGKAVIASAVGGVPEFVQDGGNGVLVPAEDPQALSHAMRRLARDEALRRSLGEQGRRTAADFDWRRIAEQYLAVYRRVIEHA